MVKPEGAISVWGIVIWIWIAVNHERQVGRKFLKDNDGFQMASKFCSVVIRAPVLV